MRRASPGAERAAGYEPAAGLSARPTASAAWAAARRIGSVLRVTRDSGSAPARPMTTSAVSSAAGAGADPARAARNRRCSWSRQAWNAAHGVRERR
jgi:hypothetical protein